MNTVCDNSTLRFQVLKLAHEILHNDYVDQKAQIHNAWSHQAQIVWKTGGVKIPYPTFPPYPSDEQILSKANSLLLFVLVNQLQVEEPGPPAQEISPELPTWEPVLESPSSNMLDMPHSDITENISPWEEPAANNEELMPTVNKSTFKSWLKKK